MIDISATLRTYLLTVSTITDLTSTRIYAERDVPPRGYQLSDGRALVFKVRGGTVGATQASSRIRISMQFKCYGATEAQAVDLYLALAETLQDLRTGAIDWAGVEVVGQTLEEPSTGWPYVLAFFTVIAWRSGA